MENEIHSTVSDQDTLPTPINVNLELGRLLNYVADVAKAIRMNSPCNPQQAISVFAGIRDKALANQ